MSRGGAGSLGNMTMGFGGDDSEFQKVADRVERRAKSVASGAAVGGLAGIGRIYLVNTIGEGLKRMSNAAVEMSQKMAAGTASFGEMVEKVAEGIPYIGHFIEAGRGIRELITGEQAYTEILKQQNAQQEKRIALVAKVFDLTQKVSRETRARDRVNEDALLKLHPDFLGSAGNIFGRGGEDADAVRQNVQTGFKAQFDEIAKQKLELSDKLRLLQENDADARKASKFVGGAFLPSARDVELEAGTIRAQLADLETQARKLRQTADEAVNNALIKAGHGVYASFADLVGGKFAGAFDTASTAIERYVQRIPEANKLTEELLRKFNGLQNAQAGNIGRFFAEQDALRQSNRNGQISGEDFRRLTDKSFADQIVRTAESLFDQFRPPLETAVRFFDSGMGLSATFGKYFGALGQVPGLLPGRIAADAKPFQASFVGLEDMGRRIQEAAGSSGAAEDSKNLAKIAEFQAKTNENTAKMAESLRNIERARTAAVGK